MHHVEHPRAVPGLAGRRNVNAWIVGESDDASLLVDRQRLKAAGVTVVAELPEQGVEVRRTDEQRAGRPVAQVVRAAECRLGTERPKALTADVQVRARVRRELQPLAIHRVEQVTTRLTRLPLIDQI